MFSFSAGVDVQAVRFEDSRDPQTLPDIPHHPPVADSKGRIETVRLENHEEENEVFHEARLLFEVLTK